MYIFEGADYEFGNSFLKFQPPVLFLVPKFKNALF